MQDHRTRLMLRAGLRANRFLLVQSLRLAPNAVDAREPLWMQRALWQNRLRELAA